jgi:hypothetical protein
LGAGPRGASVGGQKAATRGDPHHSDGVYGERARGGRGNGVPFTSMTAHVHRTKRTWCLRGGGGGQWGTPGPSLSHASTHAGNVVVTRVTRVQAASRLGGAARPRPRACTRACAGAAATGGASWGGGRRRHSRREAAHRRENALGHVLLQHRLQGGPGELQSPHTPHKKTAVGGGAHAQHPCSAQRVAARGRGAHRESGTHATYTTRNTKNRTHTHTARAHTHTHGTHARRCVTCSMQGTTLDTRCTCCTPCTQRQLYTTRQATHLWYRVHEARRLDGGASWGSGVIVRSTHTPQQGHGGRYT